MPVVAAEDSGPVVIHMEQVAKVVVVMEKIMELLVNKLGRQTLVVAVVAMDQMILLVGLVVLEL